MIFLFAFFYAVLLLKHSKGFSFIQFKFCVIFFASPFFIGVNEIRYNLWINTWKMGQNTTYIYMYMEYMLLLCKVCFKSSFYFCSIFVAVEVKKRRSKNI